MRRFLLLFVVLLSPSVVVAQTCSNTSLGTGITCVSSKDGIGVTSASVTFSSGYAAGTLIVVQAIGSFGSVFSSGNLTNTASYTWTFYGNIHTGGNDIAVWYVKVPSFNSNSDTITVAKTGGAGYVSVNAVTYTGISAIHGAGTNASGTGTVVASGNYTVSVYDLNIGIAIGESVISGTGWHARASDANGGSSPFAMIEDQIAATTTANATFTNQISDPWVSIGLAFTPNAASGPIITNLNPSSVLPGDTLTITGFAFGISQGGSTVTVNGVNATVTGWDTTSITVTVPTTTSGDVVVTVSGVASNPATLSIGPVITNVTPIWGVVGATFTITGTSFGAIQGGSTVTLNGVTTVINSWSATSISANAPNTTPGNVVVHVASLDSNGVYFRVGTTTPVLPQSTVSLTLPTQGASACPTLTTGSNCKRIPASGSASDFQSALNAAACGDTIILAAGSTYSGNFSVPATACSGWIVIQSSALASLPASNHRVSPSDASNMPLVSTPNTGPALNFSPSSNHWRLIGLDITTSWVNMSGGNNDNFGLVFLGLTGGGNYVSSIGQLPDQIIFDRVLLLGLSNTAVTKGILMDTQASAMVDSYCAEIHTGDRDSQCILIDNGTGPFLIQNNYLEASGENIMFGGSDPPIANLIPSDATIVGNVFQKNPAWMMSGLWTVKNLFETKNVQRVLLDGNVFQYTWAGQQNEAVLIRAANQSSGCTWCASADITFTHNWVRHAGNGFELDPCDCTYPSQATQRILVRNNVFTDLNSATWGVGAGGLYVWNAIGSFMPTMHDIFIDHNDSFMTSQFIYLGDNGTVSNVQFTNNLSDFGIGAQGTGTGMDAGLTLSTFLSPYTWSQNVFTATSQGTWPMGTLWSTNLAGLGMTAVTGSDPDLTGNFQLTSGSAYHNAGTDGKDIGVWDWSVFNARTANALAGTFDPGTTGAITASPGTVINPGATFR